jgi:hypothetical protein
MFLKGYFDKTSVMTTLYLHHWQRLYRSLIEPTRWDLITARNTHLET